MPDIYCLKCKKKTGNIQERTDTKDCRRMLRANCVECGSRKVQILGRVKREAKGEGIAEVASGVKALATRGVRGQLAMRPPSFDAFINKYSDWKITNISACRQPIKSWVDKGLSWLTMGKSDEIKAKMNYDNLMHLFLYLKLTSPTGQDQWIYIEKNERVRGKETTEGEVRTPDTECLVLKMPPVGFAEFIQKGEERQGETFYHYDGKDNNCQVFVLTLCEANGASSADPAINMKKFIKQDTLEILQGMAAVISRGLTDVAGVARVLQEGGSKPKKNIYTFDNYIKAIKAMD